MNLSPHPPGLGGPVGGGSKCVEATISHYCQANLLSGVATITQPETSTITSGSPTIRPKLGAYYHHDHAGSGLKYNVPNH